MLFCLSALGPCCVSGYSGWHQTRGCGQEEVTIVTRLLSVVSKHLASRPWVLFVHLQMCLHPRNRKRGRHRCTFSSVVPGCIETLCGVTPGYKGLSATLIPPTRSLPCTPGPSTYTPEILPPVGRAWLWSRCHGDF